MNNKKQIAKLWIKNHESKKDVFRRKYLEPYLKRIVRSLPKNSKILDVGCGWGTVAEFIRRDQEYVGTDSNKEFFDYLLKNNNGKKIRLIENSLPHKIKVKSNSFDLVICSLVMHNLPNINKSIKEMASKSKNKILLVDFNDREAKSLLSSGLCKKIKKGNKEGIIGITKLPSGIEVPFTAYFHKESEYKKEIEKYGKVIKKYIGPIFVSYEVTKTLK